MTRPAGWSVGSSDRGVNFIDTANIYGYGESEEIIAEALHPYPDDVVITTKAGFKPAKILKGHVTLPPAGHPDHIREERDKSLRRLRVDVIDLYQVHTPDPSVPYDETIGAFVELQQAGKVRHVRVSNVTAEQLGFAQALCDVESVENRYNAGDRNSDAVLDACYESGITFLPWAPILLSNGRVGAVMARSPPAAAPRCNRLRSSGCFTAPRTWSRFLARRASHADENVDAAWLALDSGDFERIDEVAAV